MVGVGRTPASTAGLAAAVASGVAVTTIVIIIGAMVSIGSIGAVGCAVPPPQAAINIRSDTSNFNVFYFLSDFVFVGPPVIGEINKFPSSQPEIINVIEIGIEIQSDSSLKYQ